MNAIQEPPHESENARLLPAPAYPGLSADRQLLLKEQFMSNLLEEEAAAPRIRRRRRLTIGLAAPLALAAAAAVAVGVAGNQAGPAKARHATSTPTGPVRIVNVGYTVDIKNGNEFKLTVHRKGGGKVNAARLKMDLASLGLNASVNRTQPKCGIVVTTIANPDGRGNYIAKFNRPLLNRGPIVVYIPMGPAPKITVKINVDGNVATVIERDKGRGDFLVVSLPGKPTCTDFSR